MRVLVTRAEPEAGRFAEALRARGHEPLLAPLLRHEKLPPPADLDARLDEVQAVLLTSANGARALAQATAKRDLRLLVVGDATAQAAEEHGFHDTLSASGDATALAVLVRKQIRPDAGPLLHVGGTATAGDLVGQLAEAGYAIAHVALYDMRLSETLPADVEDALAAGTIDAVTLFSPRTAEAFVKLASGPDIAGKLAAVSAVAMSEAVAERASALPWRAVVVADRPTQDEMLLAIDRLTPPPAAAADQGEPEMSDAPATPTPAAAEAPPPEPPQTKPDRPEPTRQPRRGIGVVGAFITAIIATIVVLAVITAVYLADPDGVRGLAYSLTGQKPPPPVADRIKPLQDRIAALEARPAPADPSPALRESIGRVEQRVEAQDRRVAAIQELTTKLDTLARQVETMASRPGTPAGPPPDAARVQGALSDLRAELAVLKTELQTAQTTLKALSAKPADAPPATPGAAPSADQGDASRQVAVLMDRLDRLEKRDAQAAGTTANLAEKAEVVRQLAELEARLRAEIARDSNTDSGARDAAAQAKARADAVEKEIAARVDAVAKETAAKIEGLNRDLAARAAVDERALSSSRGAAVIGVAARLRQSLESGGPFTSSLELLAPLAKDDPKIAAMREELAKVASTGVVPVRVLAGEFPAVARAVVAADLADDSFWQRVLGKLKSIVSIRRVGEHTKGMEADAVLARAEAAVNAGDLNRAVAEMKQLKGAAAAPATTWLVNAEAHLAAQRVIDRLGLHGVDLLSRGTAK